MSDEISTSSFLYVQYEGKIADSEFIPYDLTTALHQMYSANEYAKL